MRRGTFAALAIVAIALVTADCGDDTTPSTSATARVATRTPPPASPTTRTPPATASAVSSPSPTQPAPTPTLPAGNIGAALRAAGARFNALVRPFTTPCQEQNPKEQPCLWMLDRSPSGDRGIVLLGLNDYGGGGGQIIYAQDQAGAWDMWFGTQQLSYHLFDLPGDMLVCADGQGVNVRAGPTTAAAVVTLVKDLVKVRAETFVLTQPAGPKLEHGQGWYRISAPAEGWVRADFLSDAKLNTCELRDIFEKAR